MKHLPPWKVPVVPSSKPEDADPEVLIVGAGIAGLTAGYLLAKEGRRVRILDAAEPAGGESRMTSAHVCAALDDRYRHLARIHGAEGARLAAQSHAAAIAMIEKIVAAERIDCDFRRVDGYLFSPPEGDEKALDEELRAAQAAGLADVAKVASCPLPFAAGPAIRFGAQAAFEPVRYLEGLARAFVAAGGEIRKGVRGVSISGKPGAPRMHTACGLVLTASSLLIATNSPFNTLVAIHAKQAAYTTYVIALRIPVGSVPDALFWEDLAGPYHYAV